MANRYWVGGTGTWNTTSTTNWSATSGGASGASVPTVNDSVTFDQIGVYTVTCTGALACGGLQVLIGSVVTFANGTTPTFDIQGGLSLVTGTVWSTTGTITFSGNITGASLVTNGTTIASSIVVSRSTSGDVSLGSALVCSGSVTVTQGIFTTNSYAVTATSLSSSNSNTRTINLGSSTVTLSLSGIALNLSTQTGLTFNAGTSSILFSGANAALNIGTGVTFYNVVFTSTAITNPTIVGSNTFNNLTVAGRASAGIGSLLIYADQTINGTLTLSAGTNATCRTFVRSATLGTTRTLTCAAVASLTDIDFRDITLAGAAAPVSGTRLGDCKGNFGITFPAARTVYFGTEGGGNWGGSLWNTTNASGGGGTVNDFPLAQDTAVLGAEPNSGTTVTINAAYNIGTIDMSTRTGNGVTLATGTQTPAIYGNWINGTGTTLTGTGGMTFAGRGSQTITSAGRVFTQPFTINTPGGYVTQQDALTTSANTAIASLQLTSGTYDANDYNFTASATGSNGGINSTPVGMVRAFALGSGTWTIAGTGNASNAWLCSATNLTVTGTGTINLTSANARNFAGGNIQTYPTINQGGTGTLTITGSNKFANITNTALGRVQFTGGTTNEFTSFSLNGTSTAARLALGSTNTTQAILKKATAWNVGTGSLDSGNNTGLSFTAGDNNYLNISYINGQLSSTPSTGNFFLFLM